MKKQEQKKFFVVSYDEDEQQWFYDTVLAKNGETAETFICRVRPYVQCAGAISIGELEEIAKRISRRSESSIHTQMTALAVERASDDGENYVPTNYFDSEGRLLDTL